MPGDTVEFEFESGRGPSAVVDDLEALEDALDRHLENAMRQAVLLIEADAKVNAPVDTGRLRASIASEVSQRGSKTIGRVGSNLVYSKFVERGTRHMEGQFYLSNAVESNIDEIEELFAEALDNAVAEGA